MTDLSLVSREDLLRALASRCDDLAVVMRYDPAQTDTENYLPYYVHGDQLRCLGLLVSAIIFIVLDTSRQADTDKDPT